MSPNVIDNPHDEQHRDDTDPIGEQGGKRFVQDADHELPPDGLLSVR